MSDLDRLKTRVTEAVDRMAEDLWSLALRIHANPELAFKEEKAAAWRAWRGGRHFAARAWRVRCAGFIPQDRVALQRVGTYQSRSNLP